MARQLIFLNLLALWLKCCYFCPPKKLRLSLKNNRVFSRILQTPEGSSGIQRDQWTPEWEKLLYNNVKLKIPTITIAIVSQIFLTNHKLFAFFFLLWGLKVGDSAFFQYNFCPHKTRLKIWLTKMALIAIEMSSLVTNMICDWKTIKIPSFYHLIW